jgi:fatty acid desaturase
MADPRQQVSPRGIRILLAFVAAYLLVGAALTFYADLPAVGYAIYGVVGWIVGMQLFYRLHRSYTATLGQGDE